MMNLWYVQHCDVTDSAEYLTYRGEDTLPVRLPDSVYLERIRDMHSVVNLSYNKRVQAFINLYSIEKRDQVETMLGLSEYYFPMFEQILEEAGVPQELKYLAIIESALNPRAHSRAGAVGLWQFMYSTGKLYGLQIDSYVDERQDPVKATYAAAQFLKELNTIFGDWILALAAYNCGPGNVRKAIRRSGGKRNYWDIYNYLPRETRGYVPAYIAAMYVMEHHLDHNLYVRPAVLPTAIDTLQIKEKVHLQQIAEVLGMPMQQVRDLNPQYRRDVIPAGKKPYSLILPAEMIDPFLVYEDSIYAYKDSVFFNPATLEKAPVAYKGYIPPAPKGRTKLIYTIKSGDNLGYIAGWYDVRVSDLRYWNGIRGNMIRSGQKIAVYVPTSKVGKYKSINTMSLAEKQAYAAGGKLTANYSQKRTSSHSSGDYVYYTVKSGDTLWSISKKFSGVSETDIMTLNNISNARYLSPGQQLKIKQKY